MAEKDCEKWDPKDHVVLATFPSAGYAVLFLRGARHQPYVAAYGYDPETREWSQGCYYESPVDAWNQANPAVAAHLSGTVTYGDILEDMHEAGCKQATMADAREYAEECGKYVLLADYADSYCVEGSDICSWWEQNRSGDEEGGAR